MKILPGDKKMCRLIRLHGLAYLAVNAWAEAVLGRDWMDAHDNLFASGELYPSAVLRAAKIKMNRLYREGSKRREAEGRGK